MAARGREATMPSRIRLWVFVLGWVLSLAACKAVERAAPPPGRAATIVITDLDAGRFYNVLFVEIDGVAELPWAPAVHLTPGLHEVSFRYYSSMTRFEGQPVTLTLDARGGRVYRIDGRAFEDRGRWTGWIVDHHTGEVVAGEKPPAY
jgi:hypothetical protein